MIRIGFFGLYLYCNYNKELPKPYSNHLGPYVAHGAQFLRPLVFALANDAEDLVAPLLDATWLLFDVVAGWCRERMSGVLALKTLCD